MSRPPSYGVCKSEEELVERIRSLRKHRHFDADIGRKLELSKSTIRNLRVKHGIP